MTLLYDDYPTDYDYSDGFLDFTMVKLTGLVKLYITKMNFREWVTVSCHGGAQMKSFFPILELK